MVVHGMARGKKERGSNRRDDQGPDCDKLFMPCSWVCTVFSWPKGAIDMIKQGFDGHLGFPDISAGKESAAIQETLVQLIGQEDPLEKG